LRKLERVRRDFVANVSHEFKTPLTAIQGFAETLLAGAIDDPQNRIRFLELILEHSRRLARLTDDLLQLSKMDADRLELEFRHAQRHPAGGPAAHLRALLPRRRCPFPRSRRHRAGALHLQASCRSSWRPHLGRQRSRPRFTMPFHRAPPRPAARHPPPRSLTPMAWLRRKSVPPLTLLFPRIFTFL